MMRKKIVLVEDEEILRQNLEEILKFNDFDVYSFEDGLSALEQIEMIKPDIIISDLMMPGIDGYELLSKVKSKSTTMHIPFILLSARVEKSERDRCYALGANQYLIKPLKTFDLIKNIQSLLQY
ncbi:response regulator [Belliella buryatensis]|nr:response regulator [Belliella buryatensis]